jgi:hypothetical protein
LASLHHNPESGVYSVRFRYDGRNVNRSLRTRDGRQARELVVRIEETIQLIQRGRIEFPPHARAVEFIMADGRMTRAATMSKAIGLKQLFETYQARLPVGHKEESTLVGEQSHLPFLPHGCPSQRSRAVAD